MTTAGRHSCWYPWSEVKAARSGGPAPVCRGCGLPAGASVDPLDVSIAEEAAAEVEREDREIEAGLAERHRRMAAELVILAVLALLTVVVIAIEKGAVQL